MVTKQTKKSTSATTCSTGKLESPECKIFLEGTEPCKQMVYQIPISYAGLPFNPNCVLLSKASA